MAKNQTPRVVTWLEYEISADDRVRRNAGRRCWTSSTFEQCANSLPANYGTCRRRPTSTWSRWDPFRTSEPILVLRRVRYTVYNRRQSTQCDRIQPRQLNASELNGGVFADCIEFSETAVGLAAGVWRPWRKPRPKWSDQIHSANSVAKWIRRGMAPECSGQLHWVFSFRILINDRPLICAYSWTPVISELLIRTSYYEAINTDLTYSGDRSSLYGAMRISSQGSYCGSVLGSEQLTVGSYSSMSSY